jgi:NAD-dependent deacetylase sirtuin 2
MLTTARISRLRHLITVKNMSNSINSIEAVSSSLQRVLWTLRNSGKIAVLTGAGVSCASGIPDFRSPGGMYDTLRPELITATPEQRNMMRMNPTAVVDIRLFSVNQFPYLEVRRPFILGTANQQWKSTLSHFFVQVLHDKGLLQRLYTQNIDGLDHQMMLPAVKIVNLHGSLAEIKCEFCGAGYQVDQFREEVRTKIKDIYNLNDGVAPTESSNICCLKCRRPGVKPATVLYGGDLPSKVWHSVRADFPENVDLLIVAGTSLTVSPACNIVTHVERDVPRLVINRDVVGEELGLEFDSEGSTGPARDAILQGDCDAGFLWLAQQLGWLSDLLKYKHLMCPASAALLEATEGTTDAPSVVAESTQP